MILLMNRLLPDLQLLPWQIYTVWGSFFMTAIAHALAEYFAVIALLRPVIPTLRRDAGVLPPDLRRRIIPLRLQTRLMFLTAWMALVPLVTLGFTLLG
jgi:hypothetical protein